MDNRVECLLKVYKAGVQVTPLDAYIFIYQALKNEHVIRGSAMLCKSDLCFINQGIFMKVIIKAYIQN